MAPALGRPGLTAAASLTEDRGAGAEDPGHFFRSRAFYDAEAVTHTLRIESGDDSAALAVLVREIEGTGLVDATSPYSYPGAVVAGQPIDPAATDFSPTGLVSLFVRDRLGAPPALAGGRERALVQVADPASPRKSRMSDRQQIRKNDAAGYEPSLVAGPEADAAARSGFARVYTETMELVAAGERYFFDAAYFDTLLSSPASWLLTVRGPEGDTAAAALLAESDGFIHYYLSGTAAEHRSRAPSKNLIVAATDFAEQRGLPLNLGGGLTPGDGLEEFKRGFANTELPWRTHEVICDAAAYKRLAAGLAAGDFFPAYRAPAS